MSMIHYLGDRLQNLVAGLGTTRDKAAGSFYTAPTLTPEELLNAYRGAWLPRKIVDIPPLDATRKWRNWQAEKEQISAIEAIEKSLMLREKTRQAMTAARLFGGSALFIGTGERAVEKPLSLDRIGIGGLRYVSVLSNRQLSAGEIELDPASEWFNRPAYYRLSNGRDGDIRVHPSRLVIFEGGPLPEDGAFQAINGGWSDSVLLPLMEAIKHADDTAANVGSLVFEAKVDVIRIPDFMASLDDPRYRAKVIERATLAARGKGINGALLLDKEEEYEQKSASFATLPDILDRFFQAVSGAADIPMTRLFGQSPAGLNSTGESDLRNYYDRIQAMQECEMQPAMWRLDEALIRSALGSRPDNIFYIWASLWQTSDKERAEIGKVTAETLKTMREARLWPEEALSEAGANAMIETGAIPGLEAALEEYGAVPPDDDEVDVAAAMLNSPPQLRAVGDAAPRSLYIRRDVLNASAISAHYRRQGMDDLADDMHVTIVHSRQPVDWSEMGRDWSEDRDGRVRVAPGGYREHEIFGTDEKVIVLRFASDILVWRHDEMIAKGASHDWPDYAPHVTLGSATSGDPEPWQGPIVLGPEIFEEVKP